MRDRSDLKENERSAAMSASKTNLEKQKRRHAGPLIGITLALLVALALFLGFLIYTADTDEAEPAGQTRSGETIGIPVPGAPATQMNDPEPAPSAIEAEPTPTE